MRFLKAVKIFDGRAFLPQGSVIVVDHTGVIRDISRESDVSPEKIEELNGILTPGFVNAHCHLELSHLHSLIPAGTGFVDFALQVMAMRGRTGEEAAHEAMREADVQMKGSGIVAVGDICNGPSSIPIKKSSDLYYHSFVELIALNPQKAGEVYSGGQPLLRQFQDEGLAVSLAAHAPYSVSGTLLKLIISFDQRHDLPFTIHNQESQGENDFFLGNESPFYELYRRLNMDISWFRSPGTSSLASYSNLLEGGRALLVHNTFSTAEDVQLVRNPNLFWCFCPSANLFIEEKLPDFSQFRHQGGQICIGTDSLASNNRLNVLQELNHVAACGIFSDTELLAMITSNGARALGVEERFGFISAGKKPGLNLVVQSGIGFELHSTII